VRTLRQHLDAECKKPTLSVKWDLGQEQQNRAQYRDAEGSGSSAYPSGTVNRQKPREESQANKDWDAQHSLQIRRKIPQRVIPPLGRRAHITQRQTNRQRRTGSLELGTGLIAAVRFRAGLSISHLRDKTWPQLVNPSRPLRAARSTYDKVRAHSLDAEVRATARRFTILDTQRSSGVRTPQRPNLCGSSMVKRVENLLFFGCHERCLTVPASGPAPLGFGMKSRCPRRVRGGGKVRHQITAHAQSLISN
jgi:hypothetical protein